MVHSLYFVLAGYTGYIIDLIILIDLVVLILLGSMFCIFMVTVHIFALAYTLIFTGSLPWRLFTLRREKTIEASYSGPTIGTDFNPDNIVVDRSPVFSGYV